MSKKQIIPVSLGMYAVALQASRDGSECKEVRYPILAVEWNVSEPESACSNMLIFSRECGIMPLSDVEVNHFEHEGYSERQWSAGPIVCQFSGNSPAKFDAEHEEEDCILDQIAALREQES